MLFRNYSKCKAGLSSSMFLCSSLLKWLLDGNTRFELEQLTDAIGTPWIQEKIESSDEGLGYQYCQCCYPSFLDEAVAEDWNWSFHFLHFVFQSRD